MNKQILLILTFIFLFSIQQPVNAVSSEACSQMINVMIDDIDINFNALRKNIDTMITGISENNFKEFPKVKKDVVKLVKYFKNSVSKQTSSVIDCVLSRINLLVGYPDKDGNWSLTEKQKNHYGELIKKYKAFVKELSKFEEAVYNSIDQTKDLIFDVIQSSIKKEKPETVVKKLEKRLKLLDKYLNNMRMFSFTMINSYKELRDILIVTMPKE